MAKLVYSAITSLDGYVEDEHGGFGWAEPDAEVHAFVNELERSIGTYLYGRRMYETMVWWETLDTGPAQNAVARDYAELWRTADKIVYSRTLDEVSSARTRIEREFATDAIRAIKRAATADISVGGAELAGQALAAGLVDELHLLLHPIIVGGGKPALPDHVRADLEVIDERRFQAGVVYVSYRVTAPTAAAASDASIHIEDEAQSQAEGTLC
ncbi:MAG TPA: dihydrofolate reductase family protein [Solirubrobacteraceae bacterium]|jgi:dihydrofolate reductase